VEAAFQLVRAATGRTGVIAFAGACHGMTVGALEASAHAGEVAAVSLGAGVGDAATSPEASDIAREPRPVAPVLAAAVQRECMRRGLIVELGSRHASVVRRLPPLTITDEQAAAVLDRLADAVRAAVRGHNGHGQPHETRHAQ
jgi:diaminobutyrate-2-oxoglutarate transaminase